MRFPAIKTAVPLLLMGCGGDDGGTAPGETIHASAITSNQAWSSAGSPHIVRGRILVQGATLTIDNGATVEFEPGAAIVFSRNGRLQATGTATSPVTMRGSQQGRGTWIGLRFRDNGSNALRYVTMSGCGQAGEIPFDSLPGACVSLGSDFEPEESPTITLDHVTVEQALNGGVTLYGASRFGDGSTTLSVRNSGYVARIPLREATRFPLGGTFESNDSAEVRLGAGTLTESLALASGIPWATDGDIRVEGPSSPILTIPGGFTMRLRGSISVGENAPGGIRIGTEGGPTVTLLPSRDRWDGIWFYGQAVGSWIRSAVLENCGVVQTAVCVLIQRSYLGGPTPTPVLKDVTIRGAMGTALGIGNGGHPGPGSANLTITGTIQRPGTHGGEGGWPLGIFSSPVSAIPSGHYTGNHSDFFHLYDIVVRQDETWVKHDIPYQSFSHISVGDESSNPVLTIEPGVTIIARGWINVGEIGPGTLHAVGTAAAPIVFQGPSDSPGAWFGIVFNVNASASSLLDHVIVENAGGALFTSNVVFYLDLGPVIRNSVIRNSAGCGVGITGQPAWTTDFKAPALNNTFVNNPLGDICGP